MAPAKKKPPAPNTCGDSGGVTQAGEPCGRPTPDGQRCYHHTKRTRSKKGRKRPAQGKRGKPVTRVEVGKEVPPRGFEVTPEVCEQVRELATVLNQKQISDILGISDSRFRELYAEHPELADAYKSGKSGAIKGVAQTLLAKALHGDTTSAIFFLKTQAGWTEKVDVQAILATMDGDPLRVEVTKRVVSAPNPDA